MKKTVNELHYLNRFFLFFFLVSILIVAAWVKFNISKKTLVETNILVYSQMYRPVVIIQV